MDYTNLSKQELLNRIREMQVDACTCGVQQPVYELHSRICNYRVLLDIQCNLLWDHKKIISAIKTGNGYQLRMVTNDVIIGEVESGVDGFYYFWPIKDRAGYWSDYVLRAIADTLAELNRKWEGDVHKTLTELDTSQNLFD